MAHSFECTMEDCDFMVRANSENEVVSMVKEHAQEKHGMSMDRGDITKGMEQA